MDQYSSWIAQWLERQHVTLETLVENPVQDKILLFQL